ncbi:MAG TPA: DNA gyrase inhibitor YacG [Bradyrhizobium sp.]|nr:DNA gyrase inhibitor YacG [Bradyrhizobium sp.]
MPAKPRRTSSGKSGSKPCPICGKPSQEASRPFCSDRCRDVDLNRWLSGSYAIPGRKDEDGEAD